MAGIESKTLAPPPTHAGFFRCVSSLGGSSHEACQVQLHLWGLGA